MTTVWTVKLFARFIRELKWMNFKASCLENYLINSARTNRFHSHCGHKARIQMASHAEGAVEAESRTVGVPYSPTHTHTHTIAHICTLKIVLFQLTTEIRWVYLVLLRFMRDKIRAMAAANILCFVPNPNPPPNPGPKHHLGSGSTLEQQRQKGLGLRV